MKNRLPKLRVLVVVPVLVACAQGDNNEQEMRAFLGAFEKAVPARDMAFLERAYADDYVFSSPSGKLSNREQVLTYFRQQRDAQEFTTNSLKHDNMNVRVVGDMALVTNDWTSQTAVADLPSAEPSTVRGLHTGVFEKRNGRWMVIAEHDSEQYEDDESMVSGVVNARLEYQAVMKRLHSGRSSVDSALVGDVAILGRLLADDYSHTNLDGEILTKTQELERYKTNQVTIVTAELSEQQVRTIGPNTVIETGRIRLTGTNAGARFDMSTRYTTTWASFYGGWAMTANHESEMKK